MVRQMGGTAMSSPWLGHLQAARRAAYRGPCSRQLAPSFVSRSHSVSTQCIQGASASHASSAYPVSLLSASPDFLEGSSHGRAVDQVFGLPPRLFVPTQNLLRATSIQNRRGISSTTIKNATSARNGLKWPASWYGKEPPPPSTPTESGEGGEDGKKNDGLVNEDYAEEAGVEEGQGETSPPSDGSSSIPSDSPAAPPAKRGRKSPKSSSTTASSSSESDAVGSSAAPPSSSSGDGSSGGSNSPPSGSSSWSGNPQPPSRRGIPDVYPQVLCLPVTRRPIFPNGYKAVVVKDKAVIAAIKESIKRGQPYIGAFLLKDETTDCDVIADQNDVYQTGVFAQITSTVPTVEGDLTVIMYPHRRIKITELLPIKKGPSPPASEELLKDVATASTLDDGPSHASEPSHFPILTPEPATSEGPVVIRVEPGVPPSPSPPTDGEVSHLEPAVGTTTSKSSKTPAEQPKVPLYQTAFLHDYAVSIANVENVTIVRWDAKSASAPHVRALCAEIISAIKDIAQKSSMFREQVANFSTTFSANSVFEEPEKLADFCGAIAAGEVADLQGILEATNLEDRLHMALVVIKKELLNAELQSKISKNVEQIVSKRQREYYLMEQLRGIKKELGHDFDGKDKLVEKFKEKAAALNMPESVRTVFDEEIVKLLGLEPAASEYNVTRNYLDWLTQIPWGRHSTENFDLTHAVQVLDEDHYGLKDVKDRILEFLAVGKLRGTVEGKILCFVGPPGVGKTSIGKSIARALDRQFFRFSVGGLGDVAEIKGHRRTYVGAMPGKIIQALKKVQTENPLVLIDEVDKIGRGHNGDPASALLEMLDPEQNSQFLDHYLDVPVDLSRVLFVCTANTLDTIPAPLLDRMEVLEVSGYITEEKAAIAARFLAPQAKEGAGLKDADVSLTDDAVASLIRYYCRESGVRKLKQQIEKVYRKAALKIVQDIGEPALPESSAEIAPAVVGNPAELAPISSVDAAPIVNDTVEKYDGQLPNLASNSDSPISPSPTSETDAPKPGDRGTTTGVRKPMAVPADVHVSISAHNLLEYCGPPLYQKDRLYTNVSPVGVSCGLGYLGNGSGSVMPIEVTTFPGSGNITLTGKLGEVIKESAQIALTFLKANAFVLGLVKDVDTDLLDKKSIHLHMPEGSIGKEGPSAGIAILTAFLSLFSKTGISAELAMTGEMTLAGQVLPVGGLKEKILAAHRAGIKKILAPAGCKPDIENNVPASVKEGIEIVYVENVAEVIKEAFKGRNDDMVTRVGDMEFVPLQEQ